MFRWLHDKNRARPQDLLPRPDKLVPVPPHTVCRDEADARLLAMLDATEASNFRSWPELIEWLEGRAHTLRSEKTSLQRQLAATQSFVRFKR